MKANKPNILPIAPGEAHLQNEIQSYKCVLCGKNEDDNMVLLRRKEKEMVFACLEHRGVVAEFISLYGRPPLGFDYVNPGE